MACPRRSFRPAGLRSVAVDSPGWRGRASLGLLGGTLIINLCVGGSCDDFCDDDSDVGVFEGNFGTSTTLSSPTPSSTYCKSPPMPNSPFRNFSLHRSRYRLLLAGSMPSSFSCGEDSVNSSFQEVNFELCLESSRPIRVRKVLVFGTKGVGEGTRPAEMCLCRRRQGVHMYVGCEVNMARSV